MLRGCLLRPRPSPRSSPHRVAPGTGYTPIHRKGTTSRARGGGEEAGEAGKKKRKHGREMVLGYLRCEEEERSERMRGLQKKTK